MKIEKKYIDSKYLSNKRNEQDIKYIVVQTISNKPLCHYNIVEDKVYQSIPDDYMSSSVNGPRYNRFGVYHGICTKYNALTISIPETPNKDTIDITRHLIMTLKQKYKIDNDKILRIKDVTGELSPEIWVDDKVWNKDVIDKVNSILGYDKSITEK